MSATIGLIDEKIKEHTAEAEKHERSANSYTHMAGVEKRAAALYRGFIVELERDKAILQEAEAMKEGQDA